jgi:O-methyltransferase
MANQVAVGTTLLDYVRDVSLRDDAILRDLRRETADLPGGRAMLVMPEEGQLLGLLVRLISARTVLDIGTYTGYSSLCMALAVPPQGRVVTCEVFGKWTEIASRYWHRAGVADRIDLRVGDAVDTLAQLRVDPGPDAFDLVFIDADKPNYRRYYEDALALVRPGGLIVIDNTLFFGRVVDEAAQDPDTAAIREINAFVRDDDRVEISMLTMADGITLARRSTV